MLSDRVLDLWLTDRVRFGLGAVTSLPASVRELGAARAFIVSDPGVVASGVVETVQRVLEDDHIETALFDGVQPNPGIPTVEQGSTALRAFGMDDAVVVPVGGGSAIDTAKAVSIHAANPSRLRDLQYDGPELIPGRPLIAVPTTAGTGAESNFFGVITDAEAGRKFYVGHRSVLPRTTILDPELTVGLPPGPTAATGIDAMTHSLESLISSNPNPLAEALALAVIRTVAEYLPRAVADGADIEARSQLLMASHLAGIGQASGTGVGLVHAIGHAVGTRGRLPHGTALAAVLPEVLAFDLPFCTRELALAGIALGVASPADEPEAAGRAAIEGIQGLLESLGQRRTLRELGLDAAVVPTLVEDALADPAIDNSPRMPTSDEVAAILAAALG